MKFIIKMQENKNLVKCQLKFHQSYKELLVFSSSSLQSYQHELHRSTSEKQAL